jgi:hypothetical protein
MKCGFVEEKCTDDSSYDAETERYLGPYACVERSGRVEVRLHSLLTTVSQFHKPAALPLGANNPSSHKEEVDL